MKIGYLSEATISKLGIFIIEYLQDSIGFGTLIKIITDNSGKSNITNLF